MHPPIVQTFDRRNNYNGVKTGGEICFRGDIDVFIRIHKLINLQNSVNNELNGAATIFEARRYC